MKPNTSLLTFFLFAALTALFLLVVTLVPPAHAGVWEPENEWNLDWEIKYAQFAEQGYTYFRKGGGAEQYLPMRENAWGDVGCYLDCTNLPYAMRAIFAYENKLPFMTRLSGFNKQANSFFDMGDMGHFSNYSNFRSFLSALLAATYSCTLNDDTFPIAVRPDVLLPGMVFSINPVLSTGHAYMIFRVEVGPNIKNKAKQAIMVLGGTVPANIPLPEYYYFKQEGRLMWQGFQHFRRGGFRAWLVPVKRDGKWELEIPEYGKRWASEEQFEKDFIMTQRIINQRFKVPTLTPEEEFRASIDAVSYSFVKRLQIIEDGTRRWIGMGRPSTLSEATLHDLGTVNTDRRIAFAIREAFTSRLPLPEKEKMLDEYVFDISGKKDYLTLRQIFFAFKSDEVSSSPVDPIERRWGLGPNDRTLTAAEIAGKSVLPDYDFPPTGGYAHVLNPQVDDTTEVSIRQIIHEAALGRDPVPAAAPAAVPATAPAPAPAPGSDRELVARPRKAPATEYEPDGEPGSWW